MLFGVLMFSAPLAQAVTAEDLYKEIQVLKQEIGVLKTQLSGQVLGVISPNPICNPFSAPSITVLAPNGGEVFIENDQAIIKWTSCNIPTNAVLRIDLLMTTPLGTLTYNLDQTTNSGVESVIIPGTSSWPNLIYGTNFKVLIKKLSSTTLSQSPVSDTSDNLFTIIQDLPGPWLPGCNSHAGYSSQNGQPCNTSGSTDANCLAGGVYSSSTGLACNPTQNVSLYATPLSSSAQVESNSGNNNDIGIFVINFKVTAWNGDIYLPDVAGYNGSNVILYSADMNGLPENGGLAGVLTCTSCENSSSGNYVIENGNTETLTITVQIDNSETNNGAGSYRVKLQGIRWNVNDSGTFFHYIPLPLNHPKYMTSYIYLN